jgi:hypothetical protein
MVFFAIAGRTESQCVYRFLRTVETECPTPRFVRRQSLHREIGLRDWSEDSRSALELKKHPHLNAALG